MYVDDGGEASEGLFAAPWGGGGGAQARSPAPGQPSPIAVLTMFGESAAAMDCLVVLCGTVLGEW